jgi:hypothetical protein
MWVDALARYLWERGLDVFTDPDEPPGHLVVRDGEYTRTFTPGEVVALAATLLALGVMDEKGRPLREVRGGVDEALEALEGVA